MKVYCTSKNSGPSYQSDPVHMVYLGTSLEDAEKEIKKFFKYEKPFAYREGTGKELYSVLPSTINWEMVKWCTADGWWWSIVVFELKENND